MMLPVQTNDPALLDKGGAWLLDRIALKRCHFYFCKGGGTYPVSVTYVFESRPITMDALECEFHHSQGGR